MFGALDIRHACINEKEDVDTIMKHKRGDKEVFVCAECANIEVGYTKVMGRVRGAGVSEYMSVERVRELQECRVLQCRRNVIPQQVSCDVRCRGR